jgi:hypothetical protein
LIKGRKLTKKYNEIKKNISDDDFKVADYLDEKNIYSSNKFDPSSTVYYNASTITTT